MDFIIIGSFFLFFFLLLLQINTHCGSSSKHWNVHQGWLNFFHIFFFFLNNLNHPNPPFFFSLSRGEAKTIIRNVCICCCHDNIKSHRATSCRSGPSRAPGRLPACSEAIWRVSGARASGGGGGRGRGCCRRACGGHRGRGSSGCPSGKRCTGSTGTGTASGLDNNKERKEIHSDLLSTLTSSTWWMLNV